MFLEKSRTFQNPRTLSDFMHMHDLLSHFLIIIFANSSFCFASAGQGMPISLSSFAPVEEHKLARRGGGGVGTMLLVMVHIHIKLIFS